MLGDVLKPVILTASSIDELCRGALKSITGWSVHLMAHIADYETKSIEFRARIMPDGSLRPKAEKEAMLAAAENAQANRQIEEARRRRAELADPERNQWTDARERAEREVAEAFRPGEKEGAQRRLAMYQAKEAARDGEIASAREVARLAKDPSAIKAREIIDRRRDYFSADQIGELEGLLEVWKDEPAKALDKIVDRSATFALERSREADRKRSDAQLALLKANRDEARANVASLEAAEDVRELGATDGDA